jgi:hypothetical protein
MLRLQTRLPVFGKQSRSLIDSPSPAPIVKSCRFWRTAANFCCVRLITSLSIAFILLFFAVNISAQDKLVFAVDIIRHGDRTPTTELPGANPALWPEGLGQLTAEGTNQEYELGSRMRSFYLDSGLLGSNYVPGTIAVVSTATDRTRMSAKLFLMGLLANATPSIPIQTNVPATLLIPTARRDFNNLLSRYVFPTPEWQATNAALQPQFDRWSRATHLEIANANNLIIPGDTLYIYQVHHVPVTKDLTPDDVQAIINAGRWVMAREYQAEVGQITGKDLLKKIGEYMRKAKREAASPKGTRLKYVLFSAHDSTLLSEMSVLRAPLTGANTPPYASFLHFALFEAKGGKFHIQIAYHDEADHVVPNPADGGASWSLAQFLKWLNNNLPRRTRRKVRKI